MPLAVSTKKESIHGEPQTVGVENVYEYQAGGTGGCGGEGGCVGLISSGTSEHESAFLDASESGNDVFFLTEAQLSPQDTDTNFDIYDARVCGDTCPQPPPPPAKPCEGEECAAGTYLGVPLFGAPASSIPSASGNVLPFKAVEAPKPPPAKPLTRMKELPRSSLS